MSLLAVLSQMEKEKERAKQVIPLKLLCFKCWIPVLPQTSFPPWLSFYGRCPSHGKDRSVFIECSSCEGGTLPGKPWEAGILPWLYQQQGYLRTLWLHINMERSWDTNWSTAIPPGRLGGVQALPFAGGPSTAIPRMALPDSVRWLQKTLFVGQMCLYRSLEVLKEGNGHGTGSDPREDRVERALRARCSWK